MMVSKSIPEGQLSLDLEDPFDEIGIRPSEAERAHAMRVREILNDWQAADVLLGAALAAPFLEGGSDTSSKVKKEFNKASLNLAKELVKWRKAFATNSAKGTDSEWLSFAVAQLYRLSYLEVPSFSFVLLLLADHEAIMDESESLDRETALITLKVLVPLAEMLGIWSLYRKWTERSYAVLYPEQHAELRALLGDPEDYSEKALRTVADRKLVETNGNKVKQESGSPYIKDKADAFLFVKTTLRSSLAKRGVRVQVKPITHYAGLALRRVHEGQSNEDVARRLSVRVICPSTADCYATLGVIHSLGKPVSIGSSLHFKDHIASPQPNGYRALHATITLRNFRPTGGGAIVIECRILTKYMHYINERGVTVGGRFSRKTSYSNAWWQRLPEIDRQLAKTKGGRGFEGIQEFITRHQIKSISDPLYVFTPRGEVVLLPSESTPLDFAYSIHTQLGHHALRTDVNGKPVPHGYPLRNGDIVNIHYDPNLPGPLISWLGLVKTPWAKACIKRGLKWRANAAHQGRAYYEEALLQTLSWFERQKGYKLAVSTERIEDFLLEQARVSGYSEVRELYANINGNRKLTQRLVQQLISAELATSIVNARSRPIVSMYDLHHIKLCMTCRAVPGEAIVGVTKITPSGKRYLLVHVDGKNNCDPSVKDSKRIALAWAKDALREGREHLVFTLKAVDRPGLLREVLNVIYQGRKTDLLKVEARTDPQGLADIVLLVRGEWFGGLDRMSERLGRIAGVRELKDSPPSPSQLMALSATPINFTQYLAPNPYTAEEVFNRGIFYDRQDLLDELLAWLGEPAPHDLMILHGQRRVGKTSLVKYFMYEYLPPYRTVRPIFVDLQGLNEYTSSAVASLIVRRVYDSIKLTPPIQEPGEPVWVWADRTLREALTQHSRLLIVIDEFNFLIDEEHKGKLDAAIYNNLRFLMNARREIKWLFVVQDTHFMDRERWLSAGVLFQTNRTLSVPHLDRDWASRLALEPAKKCGVTLKNEDRMLNRIYRLTNGNPFLIHLICHELVNRAREKNNIVEDDALHLAAAVILHVGKRHFDHFTKSLTDLREVVMAAVASLLRRRKSVPEIEVFELLQRKVSGLQTESIEKNLRSLAAEGQIDFKRWTNESSRRIKIPIELYRQFITDELHLDDSIEKWRNARDGVKAQN